MRNKNFIKKIMRYILITYFSRFLTFNEVKFHAPEAKIVVAS